MGSRYSPEYQMMLRRLRAARKQAGLTQAEVARRIDRPQSYVSKLETGERRIDPVELHQLAQLYGKPLQFFLEEDD